jgi:hypothetical protein
MTTATRTAETNAADALAELLYNLGDGGNLAYWVERFQGSFPSPIIGADVHEFTRGCSHPPYLVLSFEDGSVLHLTVTQVKESNQ